MEKINKEPASEKLSSIVKPSDSEHFQCKISAFEDLEKFIGREIIEIEGGCNFFFVILEKTTIGDADLFDRYCESGKYEADETVYKIQVADGIEYITEKEFERDILSGSVFHVLNKERSEAEDKEKYNLPSTKSTEDVSNAVAELTKEKDHTEEIHELFRDLVGKRIWVMNTHLGTDAVGTLRIPSKNSDLCLYEIIDIEDHSGSYLIESTEDPSNYIVYTMK